MIQKSLQRINELAHIAKQRPLTEEELAERDRLRKEYLANFRQAFRQQLDNTYIQYDDGRKVPLSARKRK